MSEHDAVMKQPNDEAQMCITGRQEEDAVREIEVEELELAAGGSDGWAVGHN